MKKLLIPISVFGLIIAAGCASNANQKISSPLIGLVRNEYTVINITVDGEQNLSAVTNALRGSFRSVATNEIVKTKATDESKETSRRTSLGRGNEIFAIDNQILVGHDIGNATSNAVSASASVPVSL